MPDIIELRGPGNNGNELITVERVGGVVNIYRDGVLSDAGDVAAVLADARVTEPPVVDVIVEQAELFKVRGELVDLFVKGATADDFATGVATAEIDPIVPDTPDAVFEEGVKNGG